VERRIQRHATRLFAALDPEFHVGDRVRTLEGLIGRIVLVDSSFSPGAEQYQVILDNGQGGGTYLASQLRPVPADFGGGHQAPAWLPAGVTAALEAEADLEHTADLDYPEMGTILHDRPDPGREITVIGMRKTAAWTYDNSIKGRLIARSPEGEEHAVWTSGMGLKNLRHPHDMPVPLYHGSSHEFAPGEQVEPGHPGNFVSRMKHVYMTEQPEHSADFAEGGYKGARGYGRHVYEVRPTDWYGHRRDARGAEWATEGPLEIVRKVPDPREHLASTYADGFDPREDTYNGEPEVGGIFWQAPAEQAFVQQEGLDDPEEPAPAMGPVIATTISGRPGIPGEKIDDHGDAPGHGADPGHPRAAEPNSYDDESTEGQGDPKWSDPMNPKLKKSNDGAAIGMFPEGISSGGGPGLGIGGFVASSREERGDRWWEYQNRPMPDTVHRGIHVTLPDGLHEYVYDESRPAADRAHALAAHFAGAGLGVHWTPHINIAHRSINNAASGETLGGSYHGSGDWDDEDDRYAAEDEYDPYFEHEDEGPPHERYRKTDVIFHARRPGRRNELRNPDLLNEYSIGYQYGKGEDEMPLKHGSPVRLTGISWKLHEPGYPNEPYEHHDFDRPVRHEARQAAFGQDQGLWSGWNEHARGNAGVPDWIKSQRKAAGMCELCGQHPAETIWAGTGEDVCWDCAEKKRGQHMGAVSTEARVPWTGHERGELHDWQQVHGVTEGDFVPSGSYTNRHPVYEPGDELVNDEGIIAEAAGENYEPWQHLPPDVWERDSFAGFMPKEDDLQEWGTEPEDVATPEQHAGTERRYRVMHTLSHRMEEFEADPRGLGLGWGEPVQEHYGWPEEEDRYDPEKWTPAATPEQHKDRPEYGMLPHTLSGLHSAPEPHDDPVYREHLVNGHGWSHGNVDRTLARGNRLSDMHQALHDSGMVNHSHGGEDPRHEHELAHRFGPDMPAQQWRGDPRRGGTPLEDPWDAITHSRPYEPDPGSLPLAKWSARVIDRRGYARLLSGGLGSAGHGSAGTAEAIGPRAFVEHVAGGHGVDSSCDEIHDQLERDYPPDAIEWVRDIRWSGPQWVPFDEVDWDGRRKWATFQQPDKVRHFMKKGRKKEKDDKHLKPSVCIRRPGERRVMVADGHHRAVSYLLRRLNGEDVPGVWAWVGHPHRDTGPWDELHAQQEHDPGDDTTADTPGPEGSAEVRKGFQADVERAVASFGAPHPTDMEGDRSAHHPDSAEYRSAREDSRGYERPGGGKAAPAGPAADRLARPLVKLPAMSEGGTRKQQVKAAQRLLVTAAGDPSFRFEVTASWNDVVAKAKRMRAEGKVRLTLVRNSMVIGEVQGDHATYESGVQRYPGRPQGVMAWICGCPWASFHQNQPKGITRFAGRMCSHAYSIHLEAASQGMFGRQVHEQPRPESWESHDVVTKSWPPYEGEPHKGRWAEQWLAPAASRIAALSPAHQAVLALTAAGSDPAEVRSLMTLAGIDPDAMIRRHIEVAHNPEAAALAPDPVAYHQKLHELGAAMVIPHRHENQQPAGPQDPQLRLLQQAVLTAAGALHMTPHGPVTWDEIGERYPGLYGDPEVHGEKAEGADGEGIGWAANQLANDRPEDPNAENSGAWDLHFFHEKVDPWHIDYARHGRHDPRTRDAIEGYVHGRPHQVPPVILVHRHGIYQVADGHHRAEAAFYAGKKVDAFVAYSEHPDEPFSSHEGEPPAKGPFHGAAPHPGVPAHRDFFRHLGSLRVMADQANAPWGVGAEHAQPPAKPYGATSQPEKDRDPGSYGPLAGPDPDNWGEIQDGSFVQMPLSNEAALTTTLDRPQPQVRVHQEHEHERGFGGPGEPPEGAGGWGGDGSPKNRFLITRHFPGRFSVINDLDYEDPARYTGYEASFPDALHHLAHLKAEGHYDPSSVRYATKVDAKRTTDITPEFHNHYARWFEPASPGYRPHSDPVIAAKDLTDDELRQHMIAQHEGINVKPESLMRKQHAIEHKRDRGASTARGYVDACPSAWSGWTRRTAQHCGYRGPSGHEHMPAIGDALGGHDWEGLYDAPAEGPTKYSSLSGPDTGDWIPENQESFPFSDQSNTAGPSTSISPKDPQGLSVDASAGWQEEDVPDPRTEDEAREHLISEHGYWYPERASADYGSMLDFHRREHLRIPYIIHHQHVTVGIEVTDRDKQWLRDQGIEASRRASLGEPQLDGALAEKKDEPEGALEAGGLTGDSSGGIGGGDCGAGGPDDWGSSSPALLSSWGSCNQVVTGNAWGNRLAATYEAGAGYNPAADPSVMSSMQQGGAQHPDENIGQNPGMGSMDEPLAPSDSSIQTIGQQQWSGGGSDSDEVAVEPGQPQGEGLDDIVGHFQKSAAAAQYAAGGSTAQSDNDIAAAARAYLAGSRIIDSDELRHGVVRSGLFRPGSAGGPPSPGHLVKEADVLPPHEADELIREGRGTRARNLDLLDLTGTHYVDDPRLDDAEDDVIYA
jgi:hypothetical protein